MKTKLAKRVRSYSGFTLVELMVVVVIIAVLAAIAIPSYMKYVRDARTAEAVSNLGAIQTFEETYFSENDQYVCAQKEPGVLPKGGQRQKWLPGAGSGWDDLGNVMPQNREVFFQYEITAGEYTAAGGFLTNAVCVSGSGNGQPTVTHGTGNGCNQIGNGNFAGEAPDTDLGIPAVDNTFWFVVTAMGDQDGDNNCSLFVAVTDRPDITAEERVE